MELNVEKIECQEYVLEYELETVMRHTQHPIIIHYHSRLLLDEKALMFPRVPLI